MFIIGAIFGEIGKRLPIFNKYIGGAPVMTFVYDKFVFQSKKVIQNLEERS
jgi:Na+/citrate or Na+/malate symporter